MTDLSPPDSWTPSASAEPAGIAAALTAAGRPLRLPGPWSTYAKLEAEKAKLEAEVKGDTSGLLAVPGLGSLINDADGAAVKQAELAHIEGILQGMDAIKAVLGPPGRGNGVLPPVYLLGFDASNLGHAIVSIGNPDTARNLVTYVPGLGSGFASTAPGDLTRTTRLWRQASAIAPAGVTVASVYWLGYDAPQLDLKLSESSVSPLNLAEDAQVAFAADAQGRRSGAGQFRGRAGRRPRPVVHRAHRDARPLLRVASRG